MVSHRAREIKTQNESMNPRLVVATAIVSIQALGIWLVGAWSAWAIFQGDLSSLTSSLFLMGLLLGAALWASNIALGLHRRKTWSHTAAMVLQLLVASIGTASFAGEFGSMAIGWGLLLPAAVTFYLLFSKQVRIEFGKD
ncbi:MAG: hypothetical protein RL718_732 [Actinomycetota bacterium]